jgi:hypothetical protein
LSEQASLEDRIEFRLGGGMLGRLAAPLALAELNRMFGYRHRITRMDLALKARYPLQSTVLRVAVSGSSGMIGTALVALLSTQGVAVQRITRKRARRKPKPNNNNNNNNSNNNNNNDDDDDDDDSDDNCLGEWAPSAAVDPDLYNY